MTSSAIEFSFIIPNCSMNNNSSFNVQVLLAAIFYFLRQYINTIISQNILIVNNMLLFKTPQYFLLVETISNLFVFRLFLLDIASSHYQSTIQTCLRYLFPDS